MGIRVAIAGYELGTRKARKMLDTLIDSQRADDELADSMAPVWENLQRTSMTRSQLEAAATGLVARAADVKTIRNEVTNFAELQTRYRNAAKTEQDHAILDSIDTQGQIARDRMLSSNPKLQEQGRELWSQVFTAQREFATKNEDQAITAAAAEETQRRQLGEDNFSRRRSLQSDYLKESQPYIEATGSFSTLEQLYNAGATRDTPAASQAAAAAYMHVMNPAFNVRMGTDPGEDFWNDLPFGKVIQQVALNGASLTEEQWRSMYETASSRMAEHNEDQSERNTRAENSGKLFLEPKYIDFILPVTPLATVAPRPEPKPTPDGDAPPVVVPTRGAPPSSVDQRPGSMVTAVDGVLNSKLFTGLPARALHSDGLPGETEAEYRTRTASARGPTHVAGRITRNTDEFARAQ